MRGPDSPEKQKVQKLAAELQLLDTRVFFPPPVSEDALVQTAAEADVGIIPYKPVHEGYRYACPNKRSQYMHAGLAIITNDLPYVKEVVADAACGVWYDSSEETSMVRAFRRMLEDAEFRQRCCKNARDYARQKFNWQNYGERLMNIYAIEISRNSRTGNL